MTNVVWYNQDNPATVKRGSLILCHSPDIIGWAIRAGERIKWHKAATWNHVAIASETGTNPLVIQATINGVTGDKHLTDLEGGAIAIVPPLSSVSANKAIEFATAQLSDAYGYLTLVGVVVDQLLPRWLRFQIGRYGTWICSALAAETWRYGGWLNNWPDIYSVSPAEVAIAVGLDPSVVFNKSLRQQSAHCAIKKEKA